MWVSPFPTGSWLHLKNMWRLWLLMSLDFYSFMYIKSSYVTKEMLILKSAVNMVMLKEKDLNIYLFWSKFIFTLIILEKYKNLFLLFAFLSSTSSVRFILVLSTWNNHASQHVHMFLKSYQFKFFKHDNCIYTYMKTNKTFKIIS